MKKLRLIFVGIFLLVSIPVTYAQTANDIINKFVNAIGGRSVLAKVKSIYLEGTAETMGNKYPTNTTILVGKGFKSVTSVNFSEIIQCFTDSGSWSKNPLMGQSDPTPVPAGMTRIGQGSFSNGGLLANYKSLGYTDSLAGRENIQGVNAYKIKLSQPGISIVYYIDPSTYYILRTDTQLPIDGKDEINTRTFSNYKKTDIGFVVACTIGLNNMGYDVTLNYNKVEVNKDIDSKIFELPK